MSNYQNGKIYKIMSNETDLCYIGSTTQTLSRRMADHRRNYKNWLNENSNGITSSYEILKYLDAHIVLIEKYPCNDKSELCKKEQEYIDLTDCVNKVRAFRSYEDRKIYNKEYHQKNKDEILKQKKEYREMNKERIVLHINAS